MRHKLWLYLLFLASFITSCLLPDLCSNTVEQGITSPNNLYHLVKFVRSCGATVRNTTEVSILKPGEDLGEDEGNILRIYEDSVQIQWLSEKEVIIRFPEHSKIFRQESEFKGITVKYEKLVIATEAFDSSKRIVKYNSTLDTVYITHAKWRWENKVYNIQRHNDIAITDPGITKGIAQHLSTSLPIDTNYIIHTDWMMLRIAGEALDKQLVLIRERNGRYYISDKNDYYDGTALSKYLSDLIAKNDSTNIGRPK